MTKAQDEVREVKVHAISLSRPRSRKRTPVDQPPSMNWVSGVLGSFGGGMSRVLESAQQSWLALLGISSLAIKNTGQAWQALVSEGADVQAHLGRRITDVVRRFGIPGARKGNEVGSEL
jgi:hypothetical protein